jgi:hypothetical protein
MKVVIRFSEKEELKALPILLRKSSGMVLPKRTYILDDDAVRLLRKARVRFTEIAGDAEAASAPSSVDFGV